MFKIYNDNKVVTYRVLLTLYVSQLLLYIYIRGLLINSSVSAKSYTSELNSFDRLNILKTFVIDNYIIITIIIISILLIFLIIAINIFVNSKYVFRLVLCSLPLSIISSYFILNTLVTHSLTNFIFPTIPLKIVVATIIHLILSYTILKIFELRKRKEENVKNNKL